VSDTGPTLAVIGAINVDLVVAAATLPRAGETVVGGTFAQHHGGKGGNQAVAAARVMHGRVGMIGAVGEDAFGVAALEELRHEHVYARRVTSIVGATTGVALVVVDRDGENQISVAPGANARLTPDAVLSGLAFHDPGAVLASLEVPTACVRAAAEWCREHDVTFVLNPAPASEAVAELAGLATYLTPNEGELDALRDVPDDVVIIETRGAGGAMIHANGRRTQVPAPRVETLDTTGAGDCFNGVFASGLLEGLDLPLAVRRAVVASALSVTRAGARNGMPRRDELDAAMASA
jgi:ribokinase